MFCTNCGCMTLDKECEWCGPADLYKDKEKYCEDCGGVKSTDNQPLNSEREKQS